MFWKRQDDLLNKLIGITAMDLYEIVFKGEVMPNLDLEQVAAAMAKLFKTSEQKIAALFNGNAHTLKSGLERDAAEKYRDTLKKAGAIVYLRRAGIPARSAGDRPANRSNGGLSVAPMVGNLVRDEERATVAPVNVDTSGIELAANDGSPLAPATAPAPAAPDTSHISIAEAGAELNPGREVEPPAPAINTDDITLADPDSGPHSPPAPIADTPTPDTSALKLEPPGEILKEHEKPKPVPAPALLHDFDLYDPD